MHPFHPNRRNPANILRTRPRRNLTPWRAHALAVIQLTITQLIRCRIDGGIRIITVQSIDNRTWTSSGWINDLTFYVIVPIVIRFIIGGNTPLQEPSLQSLKTPSQASAAAG